MRWMRGVTREYRIRYEYVRGRVGMTSIVDKMRENRLKWFGLRVMRRQKSKALERLTFSIRFVF